MKLVRQIILCFREGSSDKVYEVDLCEVGPDQFVVNFRYGRRGAALKEGTKTAAPVALAPAEKVFQELVNSKTKKGYREVGASEPEPVRRPRAASNPEARAEVVLERLRAAVARGAKKSAWPIERAIWRAGELKLRDAAPLLRDLIGSGGPLRDYCIAWALGWCGGPADISALGRLFDDPAATDAVRRMAREALLKLADEKTRDEFRAGLLAELPRELREAAAAGPATAFASALAAYLDGAEAARFAVLDVIYLIDNAHVRPALLALLRTTPLRPPSFQRLRHIFKAAEYRRDAEVFGLIAYRFEKERAMFSNGDYPLSGERKWSYVAVAGSFVKAADREIKKPDSPLAYGSRTRHYLRHRVWRTLRRLGELGDADYVKMAVGVLLPFSDADAQESRESSFYRWETRQTAIVRWDAYAAYWAFNHLLYANSPRYVLKPHSVAWRCRPTYKPGDPEPAAREEAFPELWERTPVGLLHLVSESACRPVQHFAVKALRACREFTAALDREVVIMILGRPYEVTADFGYELARERYRPAEPDYALVLAVANCASAEARAGARRWVEENRERYLTNGDFIVALATGPRADTRDFARHLLRSAALTDEQARALVVRLVAYLIGLSAAQKEEAQDVGATLLQSFGPQLRTISLRVVLDLLAHPLMEVRELGGQILLNHATPAGELPGEIINSLINSPDEPLRGIGIRLLGQLPEENLLARETLLAALASHPLADVRQAVRPVILRLAGAHEDFGRRLALRLVERLLLPEEHEGVHQSLAGLLREEIGGAWRDELTKERLWQLARSSSAPAAEFGGRLIEARAGADARWAQDFSTDEIAELANHEVLTVRLAAQTLFAATFDRYRRSANPEGHHTEMARAVRLLDVKWDDARSFFFDAFRAHFGAEDFTPVILVSICDSVRADVQAFGRELITKYFAAEAGQEYMLKLSEHPSADLQLFVTNYLERYCAGRPERLRELAPYFTNVLSRVNRARVAKGRVLAFLAAEGRRSEEAARIVAEILTRQSATVAVTYRAATIEAMLELHRAFPEVALPLDVKPVEVRRAV